MPKLAAHIGRACALLCLLLTAEPLLAQDAVDSRGELGFESRVFYPDDDARTDVGNVAVAGRLQLDAENDAVAARGRMFSRLDPYDGGRTRIVPEDIWVQGELEPVRLRVGFQMLNWSATEAFHPADIINSRILDGSFENPEKLGEPMASLRVEIPLGNIELLAMPVFTAPVLPSGRSRLNVGGAGLTLGPALLLGRDGKIDDSRWQPQWAAQIQQGWGDADVSVHVVQHIDRSAPLVVFDPGSLQVRPVYQALTQVGGTYQQVFGQLLVKVEAAYRRFDRSYLEASTYGPVPKRDHILAALGFEQAVEGVNGAELALLLEGQVLIPTVDDFPKLQKPLFEHDVLIGMRHAWNDEQSRSLLFTAILDVTDPQRLVIGPAYAQRLGESWGLTAGLRLLRYPPKNTNAPVLYENLHDAHQVYCDIKRYF